jgi:hypothetical protein
MWMALDRLAQTKKATPKQGHLFKVIFTAKAKSILPRRAAMQQKLQPN